jgi:hypothetical protein
MSKVWKPTPEEVAEVLRLHKLWVEGDKGGKRADLSSADLSYADLSYADLSYADLRSADLSYADLRSADLSYADLSYAYLSYADLRNAYLRNADLSYADLRSADLRNAYLPTGERFDKYLAEVVPALLTAGGKTVEELVPSFSCHQWANCPMHEAFGIDGAGEGPPLLVPRIEQFVHLFDNGQIPAPVKGDDGKWTFPAPVHAKADNPAG